MMQLRENCRVLPITTVVVGVRKMFRLFSETAYTLFIGPHLADSTAWHAAITLTRTSVLFSCFTASSNHRHHHHHHHHHHYHALYLNKVCRNSALQNIQH